MHSISKTRALNNEFTFIEVKQENIIATFMDYGATIKDIKVPDKNGKMESVLLSFENVEDYIQNGLFLNATIGPNSGRIKDGKFTINNEVNIVEKNFLDSENLHSGSDCFAFKFFDYKIMEEDNSTKIIFEYSHKESKSVFKGNQLIKIIYTVTSSEILIEFTSTTDKDALINMTNHAYFNLSGNIKNDILNHHLQVNSSQIMDLDNNFVPIKVQENNNDILNFKKVKRLKECFTEEMYTLPTLGIDHPYVLDEIGFNHQQITFSDLISQRKLEVYTTYPCVVIYSHNHTGKEKIASLSTETKHLGICFETQNEPNGINIDGVRNSILKKDSNYYEKTLYKFSVME